MTLEPYSQVQLVTDQYQERGVSVGAIGTILEVYDDGDYEVEFSHNDGTTIAWFSVPQNEVKPLVDDTLVAISPQKESA
jgi:Domain of unknown function (DUF4926)